MKKRTNFDKKFPLFVKYIQDPLMQSNMVDNADLLRKYDAYSETIEVFLKELDKRFDVYTVRNIIVEAIIKLPDSIMVSLITAYLNSNEEAKSNSEFITYYNRTSNMGMDCLDYIEKNGLITNRTFKDIPFKAIDLKYESVRSGAEQFNGVGLSEIYDTLSYDERKFIISLIEAKIVESFDDLFEKFQFSFKSLISILMLRGIDAGILNQQALNGLGSDHLLILVCLLLDNDDALPAIANIKELLRLGRFELLKLIINDNLLPLLARVDVSEFADKEDDLVIEELKKKELVLEKTEN